MGRGVLGMGVLCPVTSITYKRGWHAVIRKGELLSKL